jgi:hypothetical protein
MFHVFVISYIHDICLAHPTVIDMITLNVLWWEEAVKIFSVQLSPISSSQDLNTPPSILLVGELCILELRISDMSRVERWEFPSVSENITVAIVRAQCLPKRWTVHSMFDAAGKSKFAMNASSGNLRSISNVYDYVPAKDMGLYVRKPLQYSTFKRNIIAVLDSTILDVMHFY